MKSKKWMTTAAVLTLSTSLAFAAPQGPKQGGFHGRHGRGGEARLAQKLNLTDAQKTQIKEMRQNFRAANQVFFDTVHKTHQELRAAKKANDTATVERLKPVVQEQRKQMREMRKAERQQFLTVLTAEQKAQLEQMKAERQARRAERNGK